MKLKFLGATRQVTGSRYLLEAAGLRIMVDCGMFQERAFVDRNWQMPLADPGSIDVLLLTHAHLDHTGLVPRLVAGGYNGDIITTEPTVDLTRIIMTDSARIQEEDVRYKLKRHRRERRKPKHPVVPLYNSDDAEKAGRLLKGVPYGKRIALSDDVSVEFVEAGHILGSAIVVIEVRVADGVRRVVFSGDIGQWNKPLIRDPSLINDADYVVMESTYGDRDHKQHGAVDEQLARIVNATVSRGGNVVIPTFAVERAQELIYHLGNLIRDDRIPSLPVYLDSPMAIDVTDVFRKHRQYLDEETQAIFDSGHAPLRFPGLRMSRTADESRKINNARGTNIILSTSGMCTAGRIKHHLRRNIERPDSTIVFVGYQGHGTLGREILEKRKNVRIHGRQHRVRARVEKINGFSAHGDRGDLLRWLGNFRKPPKRVFLTHGEARVALKLAKSIEERQLADVVIVPEYQQVETLD